MTQKIRLACIFALVLLIISPAFSVLAQDRALETDFPEVSGIQPKTVTTEIPQLAKYLFSLGILLAGFIIFAAMIWGGFMWLTASGNPSQIQEGRDRITSAFLGILILLASYIVLNIINPQLISFDIRPLLGIPAGTSTPSVALKPDEITLISKEIPLGQAIEQGIWEETRTTRAETLFNELDAFIEEKIKVHDFEMRGVADLQKYLEKLTEDCQCGNMNAFANKPRHGASGIACTGEPCLEETKKKIKEVLSINQSKMRRLDAFKQRLSQEKPLLERELSRFTDIEEDMNICQSLYSLSEYSNLAQFYEDSGSKTTFIENPHYQSRANPLTFYCPVGGTAFDFPYAGEVSFSANEPFEYEAPADLAFTPASCPVEIPVGEVVDDLRQEAVLLSLKMEKSILLVDEIMQGLSKISDLADQFNGNDCKTNTGCFFNPCWRPVCPSGIPYDPCIYPFCKSRCLQTVGSCVGEPGPKKELAKTVEKIKEAEDELLLTVTQAQDTFPKAEFLLKNPENPTNLQNVITSVQLASSPYRQGEFGPEQDWILLDCGSAVGNIGPNGLTISSCHPRNFFACTPTQATEPGFPSAIKNRPVTIIPEKQYENLPPIKAGPETNCPEGWLCNDDVKRYNQYVDASDEVKQLLSCMRQRLDKVEKEKEIKGTLGRITSISDSKLAFGTCDWNTGPSRLGGCSHTYEIRQGRDSVSAHYGGPLCRYQKKSYAIDIGASEPHEQRYADEIIAAAKECAPGAWIGYQIPKHYQHMHVSIGRVSQCGAN